MKENFPPIDLGLDIYTVKLFDKESQRRILQEGPWFIARSYLSVRIWELNFIPKESTFETTTIWICLPQLPTEYYDGSNLEKVGRKVGKLLKINACTSTTLRERYARIYIQVPMENLLKFEVIIGRYKKQFSVKGKASFVQLVED